MITLFICLVNFINLFLKKHSKLILFFMLTLLWLLMGANTNNPDIYSYQINYSNNDVISFEIGYEMLRSLSLILGFNYVMFRIIISALGIALIHNTVKKIIDNQSAFYLLYLIYPFLMDVVQVRNFLAMAIFVFAIPYLISDKKWSSHKYVLLILLATSVQVASIVYLPLVYFVKKKRTILFKLLFFELILSLIIISLSPTMLDGLSRFLISTISGFNDKFAAYGFRQTNLGYLLYWFIQFTNFTLVYWSNKNFKFSKNKINKSGVGIDNQDKSDIEIYGIQKRYMELMVWVNMYAFLFLPFYVFQSTFERFMRNIIPLNLLAYIVSTRYLPPKSGKKLLFMVTYITYNLFLFYINIYLPYGESIVKTIFRYNWILP